VEGSPALLARSDVDIEGGSAAGNGAGEEAGERIKVNGRKTLVRGARIRSPGHLQTVICLIMRL
jgi:hypothetical protein